MTTSNLIVVELSQLRIGLRLRYDVFTRDQVRLASAGDLVTAALKANWRAANIHLAYAHVPAERVEEEQVQSSRDDSNPYDPIIVERLSSSFQRAADLTLSSATQIANRQFQGAGEILSVISEVQSGLATDTGAVLAVFAEQLSSEYVTEHDRLLVQRCSQMSVLGLTLAFQQGFSLEDQQATALAGMFHDISLLDCVREECFRISNAAYANHALSSAALLDSAMGVNPKVSLAVAQVHEQVDGTGFPKRLPQHRIIPIARILNVVDAYLTLTTFNQPRLFPTACHFHPADALAYLMFHAARGRFDKATVRALVSATSLYPVGSRVELSDASTATVLRSSGDSPSRPIVRIEGGHGSIVDLRTSQLSVVRPTMSPLDTCSRIRKSKLGEVYWR